MSDEIWVRDEIESPCVKICVLHRMSGYCIGCYRTGNEIAQWSTMSPEQRKTLMEQLPARQSSIAKRNGGRRGRRATR